MKRYRRHRISYRPGNRRGLRCLRACLICVAVAAALLSIQVVARSLRTARLNRQLVQLHTADGQPPAAEIAAPAQGPSGVEGKKTPDRQPGELTIAMMTLPDGSAIQNTAASAPAAFHKTSGDVLPDMMKLLQTNPDTVGWISINGIVHLPVVYRDNEYYLTHDFSGHHNTSGALFLDQGSPITSQTQNLLIHGHSMYDGSMFGLLTHYKKLDTLLRHPIISFSTLYEKEAYAIFAILKVADGAFDDYTQPFFTSEAAFEAYLASVRERSIYDIPMDVKFSDALLTLSTCIDNGRLLVMARKVRDAESRDALKSTIEQSSAKNQMAA